jgi:hypothetical protein
MEASKSKKQKMYVYVDESGQDDSSEFFVVVAVASAEDWAFWGDVGQLHGVSTSSLPGHPTVSVRAVARVGH